ncbi:MAG: CinA family protein [Aquificaceae bacterium]|nr:CinA family protein [Aquificaceae bacterium]MDW8236899.1 CinA family protein [Aquificaceae bacterium]
MIFRLVEKVLPKGAFVRLWSGGSEVEFFSKELEESFLREGKELIYASGNKKLEEVLLEKLIEKNLKLSVAESCSGGLISSRIVSVAGASKVFLGGIVAYSNSAKAELLGVKEHDLMTFGAVSKEVCLQMARGVRARFGADIGIGVTGIAGPGGETPQKPVGLTYISLSILDKEKVWRFEFKGLREENQFMSSQWAMELLRRELERL